MSFGDDFKQRKVFQWSVAYLAGAWLLVQLLDVVGTHWGISANVARILDVILVIGFFITLVVAWYHGDQGRQKVHGPELLIIAGLFAVGGIGLQLLDKNGTASDQQDNVQEIAIASDEMPWIAVLPFEFPTDDQDLGIFAGGLSEGITDGLSDFSYLLVLPRNSTATLASGTVDILQIGKRLGARYVLQGAVRKTGQNTRITAQLVDAQNGTQVWSEKFDRELGDDQFLAIQDEITDRIVATVADPGGVVVRALAIHTERKDPDKLTPYEAVLRYFLYHQRISVSDHLVTRLALEQAVKTDPNYAEAWASLSLIYQQEYMNNLNPLPDSLQRALVAARRAVELNSYSARAEFALAQTHYFRKDLELFRIHAERAIELNPRNTETLAMVGILMGYSGDWDRSVELTTTAMDLNHQHSGWYHFNTLFNEYRQKNYTEALIIAQKINMPDYWATPMSLAILHAQLGDDAAAKAAATELLRVWPSFEQEYYEKGLSNWIFGQPQLIAHINDGLQKAGINLVTDDSRSLNQ